MTVIDQITYLARLHGFDRRDAAARARDLLERLGLGERLTDPVDDLSLGNQQRAQIAAALVHDPDVLVLDEPFSGLDPMAVDVVLEVLREHARRGAPVLFSSHQLDVVERLCDDVVVIAGGRIRAAGDKEDLRAQFSESRYEIASAEPLTWLDAEAGVRVVVRDDGHAMFDADEATAQRVLRLALGTAPVTRFAPVQPRLAEIFRDIVTDAPADTPTTDTRPKETVR
jgi:ABC-2 type transport system ATP-binding protein